MTASEVVDEAKGQRSVERRWIWRRNGGPIAAARGGSSQHNVWKPSPTAQTSVATATLTESDQILLRDAAARKGSNYSTWCHNGTDPDAPSQCAPDGPVLAAEATTKSEQFLDAQNSMAPFALQKLV